MTNQFPEHNKFVPTPGQKEIMTKIKSKHLPFKEIKKIINMKGRDLLWRYTLKALPKIYNKPLLTIHKEQIIQELIKTQRAAWERTQSIISKTLWIKSKQRSEEQNKLDSLISQKLLQFSRQWNSPLHSITLPKHLKIYNNSLSSLYKEFPEFQIFKVK
ncbi:hypothetical protein ACTFIZ_002718 [Dictyostelium cf. discoideum]